MSYEKIKNFVIYCRWMQENDLDVLSITSSAKGFGKSSFIIQVGRIYMLTFGLKCNKCNHEWVYTGKALLSKNKIKENFHEPCPKCKSEFISKVKKFDFMKYLAYDNDEVMDKIYDLPSYSPILPDEGVRFMMGEDWAKSESKALKKLFAQMRTKHLLIFTNIPKFRWLDSKYRNDMATFWVRILKRGMAVLLHPDLGESDDPWHIKKFQDYLGHYNYWTSKDEIDRRVNKLMKHPCVFDFFMIPKVPDDIYKEYLIARDKKAFERKNDTVIIDQKMAAKVAAYNMLNNWEEILDNIKKSRKKKPTLQILEQSVFKNPKNNDLLVKYQTLSTWTKEIKRLVG